MTPVGGNQIPSIREESVEESPDQHKKLHHSDKKAYLVSSGSAEESPQNEDDEAEGPGSDEGQPEEAEGEDDAQSEQIPLLFVDVNLGEGTTGNYSLLLIL